MFEKTDVLMFAILAAVVIVFMLVAGPSKASAPDPCTQTLLLKDAMVRAIEEKDVTSSRARLQKGLELAGYRCDWQGERYWCEP